MLFPGFQSIQKVSAKLTAQIAQFMVGPDGGGVVPEELAAQEPPDWEAYVAGKMYKDQPLSKL